MQLQTESAPASATATGTKLPVWEPKLFPKQRELMFDESPILLVSGPRMCGKTTSCMHLLVKHAWEAPGARISMIGISQTMAADEGSWSLLTSMIIPQWIEQGNFGMQWHDEPYCDGTSKKPKCSVTNMHGGISYFQLDSLPVESDVKKKYLNKVLSAIYVIEAANFKERSTFEILLPTLRCPWVPERMRRIILDTNPADEGRDHFLYRLFYEERLERGGTEEDKIFRADMGLREFEMDDNIYADQRMLAKIKAMYRNKPDLYDRMCRGLWTRSTEKGLFSTVFSSDIHVIGQEVTVTAPDPQVMAPEENCSELGCGMDPGDLNFSTQIIEPVNMTMEDGQDRLCFKVMDELIKVDEQVSTAVVALELLEKVDYWEGIIGHPVQWIYYSDQSAFQHYRASSDNYDHAAIYDATRGRIELESAGEIQNSVVARIRLVRKLLFEGRIWVNKERCPLTIEMFQSILPGKNGMDSIDKKGIMKHRFDSLSYYICMKAKSEMEERIFRPNTTRISPLPNLFVARF